jgi:WXG100 family type VII secretion target
MTDGNYSFNSDSLADMVSGIHAQSTSISDIISSLTSQTTGNLEGWSSGARELYDSAQQSWNATASNMAANAALASQALGNIHEQLMEGEQANASLWNS